MACRQNTPGLPGGELILMLILLTWHRMTGRAFGPVDVFWVWVAKVSSGNFTLERGSTCWGQALPLLFRVIVAIAPFRVVVTSRAAKSVNLLL